MKIHPLQNHGIITTWLACALVIVGGVAVVTRCLDVPRPPVPMNRPWNPPPFRVEPTNAAQRFIVEHGKQTIEWSEDLTNWHSGPMPATAQKGFYRMKFE